MKKINRNQAEAATGWDQLSSSERRVVLCARRHGPLTREQLAARLGWPASSVSREVSPLLDKKVLLSNPPGKRRRNALLSSAAHLRYAVGVEIGVAVVRGALLDFSGAVVGVVREYQPDNREPPAVLRCVQKTIRELLAQPQGRQAIGIGIGFADRAAWNPAQAFATERKSGIGPEPKLVESLQAAFNLPVFSRSDASCAVLGESRQGRLRGINNGLFLLYSEGIGLGMIAEGQVVFGGWNDAGEIGHIPVEEGGDYCHCGNVGCLETISSQWALTSKAKQIINTGGKVGFRGTVLQSPPGVAELCSMAMAGDLLARNLLTRAGKGLGRALAISASLFDPTMIVLGGALASSSAYGPLVGATQETFRALTAHRTPQPIAIETSSLGDHAAVIGAAELVFSEVLK